MKLNKIFVLAALFLFQFVKCQIADTQNDGENPLVNLNIENGGGLKITYPTGEIILPQERKNVHIKTVDVFEEKNHMTQPDIRREWVPNPVINLFPKDKLNGDNLLRNEQQNDLRAEEGNGIQKISFWELLLVVLVNAFNIVINILGGNYLAILSNAFKIIEGLVKYFLGQD